jgi:hypothetical protein
MENPEMPADQSNIGMGRRRQGATGPDRTDDSNRSLDRAIGEDGSISAYDDYERGKVAGASGADTAHAPVKPGTQRDLDDADSPDRTGS